MKPAEQAAREWVSNHIRLTRPIHDALAKSLTALLESREREREREARIAECEYQLIGIGAPELDSVPLRFGNVRIYLNNRIAALKQEKANDG